MSSLELITSLYTYNEWANNALLEAASHATDEELSRETGGSFGSVQDNLLHILGSHVSWLMRWTGETPQLARLEPGNVIPALRESFTWAHHRLRRYVGSLSQSEIDATVKFTDPGPDGRWHTWTRPRWQVLMSVGTHAMHHRGEVAMALTAMGFSPGELDYSMFCWRRASE